MSSAAAVIACALTLLGRSEKTMPPIVPVSRAPAHAEPRTEAFVSLPNPVIYVVTSSQVFQDAMATKDECGDLFALKKLASILVHEEWHVRHGADERAAYEAQLTTLILLRVPPGHSIYANVVRAMQAVLKQKRVQKPDMVLASLPMIVNLP
jgi:hypothetical protein